MKIGILTFQTTNNYGAILQSYALQKVLKDHGHQPEIIDYRCEYIAKPYRLENLKKKGLAGYLFSLIGYLCYLPRTKRSNQFRKHMQYSKSYFAKTIQEADGEYDMYIVGSDQVWNHKLTNADMHYLLDFVKDDKRKFSYAASIGVSEINGTLAKCYQGLLKKFHMMSVREKQGAEIVYNLTGREAQVVLDPSLLLPEKEWIKVAKMPQIKGDYILVYQLGISKKLVSFVEKLSKQTGLRVIYIPFPLGGAIKCTCQWYIGPAEWLGLFYKASYIVTDSFHGTAFSILFNKQFYTEASGQHKGVGSRLFHLLSMFQLTDRLLDSDTVFDVKNQVDFDFANKILEEERKKSVGFLEAALQSVQEEG